MRFYLYIFSLISFFSYSKGIEGRVTDKEGKPLSFVSIFIKETNSGVISNEEGYYTIKLNSGKYNIIYQYMGYESISKTIEIKNNEIIKINIVLDEANFILNNIDLNAKSEDTAYPIMRKAIAKAKYHTLVYDEYTADAYIRGNIKILKLPNLLVKKTRQKKIAERTFFSEFISKIEFKQPNIFKERVVSYRKDTISVEFNIKYDLSMNFYNPEVNGAVSPLASNSFWHYKFKYLGSFLDSEGYEINKIEVIPKNKGEGVFLGIIYIRSEVYDINSLELSTHDVGTVKVTQNFANIKDNISMPVTTKFNINASIMGIKLEVNYFASISNYDIKVNQDLKDSYSIIDEKSKEELGSLENKNSISTKDFRKKINQYEKDNKQKYKSDIILDYTHLDTNNNILDTNFWNKIRPIPLTKNEKKEELILDSIRVKKEKDTIRKGKLFFMGKYIKYFPKVGFNTIEGFNIIFSPKLKFKKNSIYIKPYARYGFMNKRFYGKVEGQFNFNTEKPQDAYNICFEGGKYLDQYNSNAINPIINSLYTFFLKRNYIRLYEKEFIGLKFEKKFNYKLKLNSHIEWVNRNQIFNNFRYSVEEGYSPNSIENIEFLEKYFKNYKAFITELELNYQPWLKFSKYNGKLTPISYEYTEFIFKYKGGWSNIFNSETDFHRIEAKIKSKYKLSISANFIFNITVGTFIRANNLNFVDYKHFGGNFTEISIIEKTENYALLDYYNFSTGKKFISYLSNFDFRKLLITQITYLRFLDIRENIITNYLKTDMSPHYYEIGYGISNIFRFGEIEFIQSFIDNKPNDFGVRVGVSIDF